MLRFFVLFTPLNLEVWYVNAALTLAVVVVVVVVATSADTN